MNANGLLIPGLTQGNVDGCLANINNDVSRLQECLVANGHLASYQQLISAGGVALTCIGCHSDQGVVNAPARMFSWESYASVTGYGVNLGDVEASRILVRVVAGEMPPGNPLQAEQIELLRKWIQQGARETYP